MYNDTINDSLICFSDNCYDENMDSYRANVSVQGLGYTITQTKLVPLNVWYSDEYQDSLVSTSKTPPPDSTYTKKSSNGYIFHGITGDSSQPLLALDLYYNEKYKDHATVATNIAKARLIYLNYTFIATQGYVIDCTNETRNLVPHTQPTISGNLADWQMGIANSYLSVPSDFSHETAIVEGDGINNAMINQFGVQIQSLYQTNRVSGDDDIVTSKLGYWTDDGAYYYGDKWKGAFPDVQQNLSCCSLEVLTNVQKSLNNMSIPVQYWQMDDWWYIGTLNRQASPKEWGGVRGVKEWKPPSTYFPGGLQTLSESLNKPLLLYGPYFSPTNQFSADFSFIPSDALYVLPSPSDSYGFYSALLDYGIDSTQTNNTVKYNNTGVAGYEVDFMSCLTQTPYFRLNIGSLQEWLDGMNLAAKERGLVIQYCMSVPSNLMSSLSLSQVTNGRASADYADATNFDIGAGSILWIALGLKPSKDNFWTTYPQSYPKTYTPNGHDQKSCETMAIVAILSCGPVGISDKIGNTNKTLIMRTTRQDGRLLQPSRPITALNDQFLLNVFKYNNEKLINVWSTETGYKIGESVNNIYQIILALNLKIEYNLTYNSFEKSNGIFISNINNYIIRNWHESLIYCGEKYIGQKAIASNCVKFVESQQSMNNILYTFEIQKPIKPSNESLELILLTQANSFDEIVFLGEIDKYVSVSQHRFANLNINQNKMSVDIYGQYNEVVNVTYLYPINDTITNDWLIIRKSVILPKNGTLTMVV